MEIFLKDIFILQHQLTQSHKKTASTMESRLRWTWFSNNHSCRIVSLQKYSVSKFVIYTLLTFSSVRFEEAIN